MDRHRVPCRRLGVVGGDRIRITGVLDVSIDEARAAHEGALRGEKGGGTSQAAASERRG
jgi:hypothetical protein